MNVADYAAGCAALSLIVIPWAFAANRLSGCILPQWLGAGRALITAVLGVSAVLVTAEVLGMLGLFSRWSMASVSAVVSVAILRLVPTGEPATQPGTTAPRGAHDGASVGRSGMIALGFAVIAALAVSMALLGRDARVLTTGPNDDDALHYHLSESAFFVQTHSINHLHQTAASDVSVYYPLDDELLDAVTMLGPHPDLGTFGLNVGFGWLLLLGCWVIGSRWAMGAAGVAAGTVILAVPLIAGAASGPGLNDIPSMAGLITATAILVHAEGRARWLTAMMIAGLALGLAAGSKLSLLAVVVILALSAVGLAPARRWATAGVVSVGAVVTGGFWFIRDWVAVGSPVPSVNLTIGGHGFHQVPYPEVKPESFTVAHYLTNGSVIRHSFIPALKVVATPAWPVVLGLPVLGILAALVLPGDRVRRLLGIVAAVGLAAYFVTPNTALGPPGHPILFGANVRYVMPVLVIGLLLLVTAAPLRRFAMPATVMLSCLTIVLLASSTTSGYVDRWRGLAAATVVVATVSWCAVMAARSPSRLVTAAVGVLVVLLVANAGAYVQRHYLQDRYAAAGPRNRLYATVDGLQHQRIGIVGLPLQYPFTGPMLDNTVNYVGVAAPDHSFGAPTSCAGWTAALRAAHDNFVVFEGPSKEPTQQLFTWTATIPGAHAVAISRSGSVISLPATIGHVDCSARVSRTAG